MDEISIVQRIDLHNSKIDVQQVGVLNFIQIQRLYKIIQNYEQRIQHRGIQFYIRKIGKACSSGKASGCSTGFYQFQAVFLILGISGITACHSGKTCVADKSSCDLFLSTFTLNGITTRYACHTAVINMGAKNIQNTEGTAKKLSCIISQHIQFFHFHNSAFSGVTYKTADAVQTSYII